MANILKTERDLIAFLNRNGIAAHLKFFASLLVPDDFALKRLHLNYDGPSYTDMKSIEVGIPKYMVGKTTAQVLADAKWRTCHEVGHILYTPDKEYKAALKKFVKYFHKKYGIHESILGEAANSILNGMEDGREEALFLRNHPQTAYLDYFRFGRSLWYLNQDMSKGRGVTDFSPAAELFDGLFCLCSLATMGKLPLGWAQKWNSRGDLYQLMLGARKYVNSFVAAETWADAEEPLWATVQYLEAWLVDLLKKIPVQQAQQVLQQAQKAQGGGNASQNNTGNSASSCASNAGTGAAGSGNGQQGGNQPGQQSGSQGSQNSQSGQQGGGGLGTSGGMNNTPINTKDPTQNNQQQSGTDPSGQGAGTAANTDPNGQNGDPNTAGQASSPLHDAFQNGVEAVNPDKNAQGGRIARKEDEYDGEYDTDMQKIVREAMAAAETNLAEGEENAIMQADWSDLQEEQAEAADKFDQKAADEVREYYRTISSSKRGGEDWAVTFRKKVYSSLPKAPAPQSVANEAKKLNGQFAKILLNKRAFNSQNRRRGVLNTNDLYKLSLHEHDVFMKKGHPKNSDFVFYILMDGSGSMSGKKFKEALRACSLIEESLKGIAPVKIVVFDYSGGVNHHIVKEFKEQSHNASWSYANNRSAGGCNMDGFSIRVAANELLRRSEKQKVLITLSDGQPNGPWGYSGTRGENDVSEAVFETRKKGIHVFNIFFAESKNERETYLPSFQHMYRNKGVISCDPNEIGQELLRVVRRELS